MINIRFTVPIAPVTKKNSQRIINNPRTNRPMILPSKKYKEYSEAAGYFIPFCGAPIDKAVNVRCLFYMPTRRRVDLTNLLEAIDDVMVERGLLADDNSKIIYSHDGSRVLYDKDNPRTAVEITEVII